MKRRNNCTTISKAKIGKRQDNENSMGAYDGRGGRAKLLLTSDNRSCSVRVVICYYLSVLSTYWFHSFLVFLNYEPSSLIVLHLGPDNCGAQIAPPKTKLILHQVGLNINEPAWTECREGEICVIGSLSGDT